MRNATIFVALFLYMTRGVGQERPSGDSASAWKCSAWAEMFIFPDDRELFNPTIYIRHDKLHLEGRYNYEDVNTASVWGGRRFVFGGPVRFVLVPMGGLVFGNTNGIAPGFEAEIEYRKFDFYAEAEQVFDFAVKENNFFYMYTELAVRPVRSVRSGLIAQRTRLYRSDRELNRGLFGEYYYSKWRAGVFYFNPFSDDQFWIASLSMDF